MRKTEWIFFIMLPCALLVTYFSANPARAAEIQKNENAGIAARVNGVEISMPLLGQTLKRTLVERGIDIRTIKSQERVRELQREVLDALIDQELLWQEAQSKKIIAKDEEADMAVASVKRRVPFEEAFAAILEEGGFTEESYREFMRAQISVSRLIETEIYPTISLSEDEVHGYYTENPALFTREEEIRARHILIKVGKDGDENSQEEARRRIESIHEKAVGGADFAGLARKYSEDPSGPRGGDLGFIKRGKMDKPFEKAAFGLKPGEISGVVETGFGYHIIKVEERRGGDPIPEGDVRDKIRRNLTIGKIREAVRERVEELREKATIEILIPQ